MITISAYIKDEVVMTPKEETKFIQEIIQSIKDNFCGLDKWNEEMLLGYMHLAREAIIKYETKKGVQLKW